MDYVPTVWTDTTPLTARLFQHLETQYECAIDTINAHTHDDKYYPKSESDGLYFYLGHIGTGIGPDADLLDGLHATDILGIAMPPGTIMIWKGSELTIPGGWVLSDGRYIPSIGANCPDLRGRIPVGAGGDYAPGAYGGLATVTPTGYPWDGTAGREYKTGLFALTAAHLPIHNHYYRDWYGGGSNNGSGTNPIPLPGTATTTVSRTMTGGVGQPHDHDASIAFNAQTNLPSYICYCFVIKT